LERLNQVVPVYGEILAPKRPHVIVDLLVVRGWVREMEWYDIADEPLDELPEAGDFTVFVPSLFPGREGGPIPTRRVLG
jgi:hypothetical protein